MGRTYRKRKRKCQGKFFRNLSSSQHFIELTQWMKQRDWIPTCSLSPAEFFDTGRGFMTEKPISKNQVIVSIPIGLLITVSTAAVSDIGWVFKTNHEQFFAQEVLATFLVWEKHLGCDSAWSPYVNTLPSHYTVPLYCAEDEIDILPTFISERVLEQRLKFIRGFDTITRILSVKSCHHCGKQLSEVFNYDMYMWAWCSVNTRCVYIPENMCKNDIRLKDKANVALAPFLDMFNHSSNAKIEVGVSANNNYEIKTMIPFNKYSQVFILYGSNSNLKLYTEYGFVMPFNSHDFVSFSFEEILNYLQNHKKIKNSELKVDFLNDHSFTKDLSCNTEGISFNMKVVIYVLVSNEKRRENLAHNIYSSAFDEQEKEIICSIGKELVQQKCLEYKSNLKAMNERIACGCSKSFMVAIELILQYVHILTICADVLISATI